MSDVRHHGSPPSELAKAYGCLWRSSGSLTPQVSEARRLLREMLTRDEQRAGIAWAFERFGQFTDGEILRMGIENGLPESEISPARVDRGVFEYVTAEEAFSMRVPSFPDEEVPPRKGIEEDGTVESARDRILAGWLANRPGATS